jgi:hypothetical protein
MEAKFLRFLVLHLIVSERNYVSDPDCFTAASPILFFLWSEIALKVAKAAKSKHGEVTEVLGLWIL